MSLRNCLNGSEMDSIASIFTGTTYAFTFHIIIIIIIIIIISFMQGTHIPETNYVPREHGVAAILFLFMVLI